VDSISALSAAWGLPNLRVRVLLGLGAHEPTPLPPGQPVRFTVERDPAQFRGTGGVVRDAARDYPDHSYVLVANAGQLMLDRLDEIASDMAAAAADAVVVAHADGTPSGLSLLRCACLRLLPEVGYVDLKEQALKTIGRSFDLRVLRRGTPTALPIRTPADYIRALQSYHRRDAGNEDSQDPFNEDWSPSFKIVERQAMVHPTARIHDSVVLAGATVERGATVVRCIVCPGGTVHRDALVVDQLVTADSHQRAAPIAYQL
jgi:hypothetical protein